MTMKPTFGYLARIGATLIVVAAACALGWWMWQHYRYQPWTRDARVQADVANIAPRVSGVVTDLRVHENQLVHQGEVMFRIDPRRFHNAVAQARHQAERLKQQMKFAENKAARRKKLSNNAISEEERQKAIDNAAKARAAYQAARAKLRRAHLNLKWTSVRAPADGYVTHLLLTRGDYVNQGQVALTLVKSHTFRVVAYFEETKLPRITLGDPATITLMNGDTRLRGHVESISRGISVGNDAPGVRQLANVNPTFQWVRLAQRIPVRITLDHVPNHVHLSVGLSCTVNVKSRANEKHKGVAPDGR